MDIIHQMLNIFIYGLSFILSFMVTCFVLSCTKKVQYLSEKEERIKKYCRTIYKSHKRTAKVVKQIDLIKKINTPDKLWFELPVKVRANILDILLHRNKNDSLFYKTDFIFFE